MLPWKPTTTQIDCINAYAERSGKSVEDVLTWRVCLPCACEEPDWTGWAMVSKEPYLIDDHNRFYGPNEDRN